MKIHTSHARKGFSLIEVNMAIFVLAGGALALLGLFPLGLRESLAARNEMRLSAFAERFMGAARISANDPDVTDIQSLRKKMTGDFGFKLDTTPGDEDDPQATKDSTSNVYYRGWIISDDDLSANTGDKSVAEIGVQVTAENFEQNKRAFKGAPVYSVRIMLDSKNGQ